MSQKPKKTHLPLLIDNPVVNSTVFLDALTTYKNSISEFLDYLDLYSVASIHKANKQVHDPVSHQVDFFSQLNSGELPIKENKKGVVNDKYTSNEHMLQSLPDTFGLDNVWETDTEFIVYWVEKYRTSHDLVKKHLHDSGVLPKENQSGVYNTENIYFNDFSESMYSLKASTLYPAPRESLPVWDINGTFIKEMGGKHTVPNQYTGTSVFNVHGETQLLANIMSRKTNTCFRNNMKNILDCVSVDERKEDAETSELSLKVVKITDSKQPHGGNLVPDAYHTGRMHQNAEPLARIVTETLSNMSYVLNYMDKNLRDNQQAWGKFNSLSVVENAIMSVDLLHDRLEQSFTENPASGDTTQSILG